MVTDVELPSTARKAVFGVVYLRAVAAVAGYTVSVPEVDYDSVDVTLNSKEGKRNRLEFQVKCSAQPAPVGVDLAYRLKRKNYEDLRIDSVIPRFLLVVIVPDDITQWMRQSERRMNLRRCGFWCSLRGAQDLPNPDSSSITVRLPRTNLLTPEALRDLMERGIGP